MRISNHICTLAIVTLFTNCANNSDTYINDDVHVDNSYINGVAISAEDFTYENVTRADYSISETEGLVFNWSEGDTVGIYPVGGDQVAFPISEGEGSKTAQFDGGSWALRANKSYSAYYPFSKNNYLISETRIPVNYTGQVQEGNGSLSHIQPYDYMACASTTPDVNGYVNLQMKHLGCLVRFQLALPEICNLTRIRVTSDKTPFISKGYIDLTSNHINIISSSESTFIQCSLSDFETTSDNKVVTIFMMVAPSDMSDSHLTIDVTNGMGGEYSAIVNGKNMISGKSYNYSATLTKSVQDLYTAVDLGLPSGTKWATFNVGASTPKDNGDAFSWGEIETKSRFKKEDYAYYSIHSYVDNDGLEHNDEFCKLNINIQGTDYDVAHIKWGGRWVMPSSSDFDELREKCTNSAAQLNGVYGIKVTGKNGNWIFLPAGNITPNDFYGYSTDGCYWTSTSSSNMCTTAYEISISDVRLTYYNYCSKYQGGVVRPVWK